MTTDKLAFVSQLAPHAAAPTSGVPRVSVVMPAYNAETTIAETLDSILAQTFEDFELVAVDDCSTDATPRILAEYAARDPRVRVVRNERNSRICRTLNHGIEVARAALIARIDADDWCYPDRLAKQVAYMDAHPEVVVSGGTIEICDERLQPLTIRAYHPDDRAIRAQLFRYSPFAHPAVIYRTEAVRAVGGYNPSLREGEDYDLYFRLGTLGAFGNLPDRLIRLRTSRTSLTQVQGRRLELRTLYIRVKAVSEYGYRMSVMDATYFAAQLVTMFLMPSWLRFWAFAFVRSRLGGGSTTR
ncbi:MAG: glycosyltransferase family 2 protein [Dehalococcoidia bacterium]